MANWRPEGWKPLWTEEQIKNAPESIRLQMQMCYEDGADAMLKALRKRGKHITGHGVKTVGGPSGYHYEEDPSTGFECTEGFIPDEKVKP